MLPLRQPKFTPQREIFALNRERFGGDNSQAFEEIKNE